MTRQVMKVSDYQNQFTAIRDTSKEKEYALYEHSRVIGKDGFPVKHRKLIGRFDTLYHVIRELEGLVVI